MPFYLIATPIGHLGDLAFRAIDTLKGCDYLLCEDTRRSKILLDRYQIKKELKSYHKFNERHSEKKILEDLKKGMSIGLLSDAGTPGIADPGISLVRCCLEEKVPVSAVPGACSAIIALILSGLDTYRFQYVGFLPKGNSLKGFLREMLDCPFTSIAFETPHRLLTTLRYLEELAPDRKIAVARELTKTFEEIIQDKVSQVHLHFQQHPPKGEIVLCLEGKPDDMPSSVSAEEILQLQKEFNLSQKQSIQLLSKFKKIPKKELYKLAIKAKDC